MEYVPNGTLLDLLQIEAKLPWDLRYQLAIDIADGIDLLHCNQILHRDLRSHNVLLYVLNNKLRAKLSDFGLSTVKSSVRTTSTTKRSDSTGTLAWMAPELFKRGGKVFPRFRCLQLRHGVMGITNSRHTIFRRTKSQFNKSMGVGRRTGEDTG